MERAAVFLVSAAKEKRKHKKLSLFIVKFGLEGIGDPLHSLQTKLTKKRLSAYLFEPVALQ